MCSYYVPAGPRGTVPWPHSIVNNVDIYMTFFHLGKKSEEFSKQYQHYMEDEIHINE